MPGCRAMHASALDMYSRLLPQRSFTSRKLCKTCLGAHVNHVLEFLLTWLGQIVPQCNVLVHCTKPCEQLLALVPLPAGCLIVLHLVYSGSNLYIPSKGIG